MAESRTIAAPGNNSVLATGVQGVPGGVPIPTAPAASSIQKVEGAEAAGAAATKNPVLTAGKNNAGNVQTFLTDANGAQVVATDQAGADAVPNTELAGMITPPGTVARRLGVANYGFNGTDWDRIRATVLGLFVQGPAADGAAASGNPVQIAGKDIPGNLQTLAVNPNGVLVAGDPTTSPGDGISNSNVLIRHEDPNGTPGYLGVSGIVFNGATWDRMRGSAFGLLTQGSVANDLADTGNPVKVGGRGSNVNRTNVANDDRVDALFDLQGRLVISPFAVRELQTDGELILTSDVTEKTILATGGAGVSHDLTLLVLSNSSSTKTVVTIRDGTAGTIKHRIALAADGGGAVIAYPKPKKGSANANWTAQSSVSVASVTVSVEAIKTT